jgi:hypothetical protein
MPLQSSHQVYEATALGTVSSIVANERRSKRRYRLPAMLVTLGMALGLIAVFLANSLKSFAG